MKKILIFLCIFMLAVAMEVSADNFNIAGPYAANVDTDPATTVNLNTLSTGIITDLNIQIELGIPSDLPHAYAWWGDYDIWLEHAGTLVKLAQPPDSDDWGIFNVVFDDGAADFLSYDNQSFYPLDPSDPHNRLGTYKPF